MNPRTIVRTAFSLAALGFGLVVIGLVLANSGQVFAPWLMPLGNVAVFGGATLVLGLLMAGLNSLRNELHPWAQPVITTLSGVLVALIMLLIARTWAHNVPGYEVVQIIILIVIVVVGVTIGAFARARIA